jgi:polysaccharide pyruvyl transferase WcaK-like protein
MKKAYLKGYYGYKNFGDEIMLFGISDFLVNHYNINNLTIEVGDFEWIHRRQKLNRKLNIIPEKVENAINIVPIQQHKRKQLTHLLNIL